MQESGHSDSRLIDLIYAAMLGEASWQDFLDGLSDNVPDGRTLLFSLNTSQPDDFLAMASRFEGPELEAYGAHYVGLNPWLEHCAVRKVGLGVHSDQIVPHEEMVRTEFYNDFLVPNDIARSIGVTIDKHDDSPLIVSTVTSRADPDLNSVLSDQLTRISPHLRRAARFHRDNPSRWRGFDLGVSLFDEVDMGAVIVGENGRIKSISPAGQELIDGGTTVVISPLGQLRLRSDDAQSSLQAMLKRSYSGDKSVSHVVNGTRLTLVRVEKDRISLYFEGPTVVILMEGGGNGRRMLDLDGFASLHGLTAAERRAVAGIFDGKSLGQIAEEASLSRETIRSQLKSIYAKTGVNRQVDLMRLACGLGLAED